MKLFLIDACLDRGIEDFEYGRLFFETNGVSKMMHIFPTRPKPPLAFLVFSPLLKQAGIDFSYVSISRLIENNQLSRVRFYDDWQAWVKKNSPGIFAFTTNAQYYPTVINLSRGCKKANPDNLIIHGGPQASALGRTAMEMFDCIDYSILGEGETALIFLIESIKKNTDIPYRSILWRVNGQVREGETYMDGIDLDKLPLPDFKLTSPNRFSEAEQHEHILIETSRGCPYQCTFCTNSASKVHNKKVVRVLDEIEKAKQELTYPEQITFISNHLFMEKEDIKDFCQGYIHRNIGMPWGCFARVDQIDQTLFPLMKRAGCRVIHYGIESGSEKIQKQIRKNINLTTAYQTVQATISAGITATANFVMGFPEETEDTLNNTLSCMLKLVSMGAIIYPTILSPHFGTKYHQLFRDELVFNPFRQGEIYFEEDRQLILQYPDLFSFFYYVDTKNISIQEWESLYLVFIDQLIRNYWQAVKALNQVFKDNYLEMHRQFMRFASTRGMSLIELLHKDVAIDSFYQFTREILNNENRMPPV